MQVANVIIIPETAFKLDYLFNLNVISIFKHDILHALFFSEN